MLLGLEYPLPKRSNRTVLQDYPTGLSHGGTILGMLGGGIIQSIQKLVL